MKQGILVLALKVINQVRNRSMSIRRVAQLMGPLTLLCLMFVCVLPLTSMGASNGQYRFKITKGKGTAVCDSYLIRLNTTHYYSPPYCGRPENDAIPGFKQLKYTVLDAREVNDLFPKIYNYWFPQATAEGDDILALRKGSVDVSPEVNRTVEVWRYDEPIDIENDGHPVNLLMWRGYGVDGSGLCGASFGRDPSGYRQRQVPLVIRADSKTVDDYKTRALLQNSVPVSQSQRKFDSATGVRSRFKAIGRSVGIFSFKDIYYLDAFSEPSGNSRGDNLTNPRDSNLLSVYRRAKGKSTKLCEYLLKGHDYPTDDDGV
jgi:hypothetical protein